MNWWISTVIILVALAVAYYFLFRSMNKRKNEFDKMYKMHKQVKDIFVLKKKIVKKPLREGLKFPRVKTYQVVARITISQAMKGQSFTSTQTHTFMIDKKEFQKLIVNQKYRVELAGNYIGKIISGKKAG